MTDERKIQAALVAAGKASAKVIRLYDEHKAAKDARDKAWSKYAALWCAAEKDAEAKRG